MSTGADCRFTETAPGRWTYELQQWPYGETEEYETFGPFASYAAAQRHLSGHHANPGGWSTRPLPEGQHVHEWTTGDGDGPIGFDVTVRVESLGPNADPAAVIALVKGLAADSPVWRVTPRHGWIENVTRCDACGKVR